MMKNQDALDAAMFRRSKALRWAGNCAIISIYQTIHVNTKTLLGGLPCLADVAAQKGPNKASETKAAKKR